MPKFHGRPSMLAYLFVSLTNKGTNARLMHHDDGAFRKRLLTSIMLDISGYIGTYLLFMLEMDGWQATIT